MGYSHAVRHSVLKKVLHRKAGASLKSAGKPESISKPSGIGSNEVKRVSLEMEIKTAVPVS